MSLNIKSNYENDSNEWVVALNGELDISCANKLKEELYKAVDEKFADVHRPPPEQARAGRSRGC